MKVDLQAYGLVSFSRFWRAIQGHPLGNLAIRIYKSARAKGIDVLALTSATEETPTGINDRFRIILESAKRAGIPYEEIGKNQAVIYGEKPSDELRILRTSLVPTIQNNQRTDIYVLGDYLDFDCQKRRLTTNEALKIAMDQGSLIFMKPSGLFGSDEVIERYGHLINGVFLSSEATPRQNKETTKRLKQIALQGLTIPAIPVSGAHTISGIGRGYIEVRLDLETEEQLVRSLEDALKSGRFKPGEIQYATMLSRMSWGVPFMAIEKIREELVRLNDRYGLRRQH